MDGERLTQLRMKQSLSQDELAELLGISRDSVSAYERGIREPGILILKKISLFFDISADYLLGLTDEERAVQSDHHLTLPPNCPPEFVEEIKVYMEEQIDLRKYKYGLKSPEFNRTK